MIGCNLSPPEEESLERERKPETEGYIERKLNKERSNVEILEDEW